MHYVSVRHNINQTRYLDQNKRYTNDYTEILKNDNEAIYFGGIPVIPSLEVELTASQREGDQSSIS